MCFCTFSLLLYAQGCKSSEEDAEAEQFEQNVAKDFEIMRSPLSFVPVMRKYAVEKLCDLSDEQRKIIMTKKPHIESNFDGTEYAFTWKSDDGKHNIEVLSTPPPCTPIAVFCIRRTYFP